MFLMPTSEVLYNRSKLNYDLFPVTTSNFYQNSINE